MPTVPPPGEPAGQGPRQPAGIVPLRPLTLGEQMSGAVRAIRFNPGATLLPAFLVGVLTTVVTLLADTALGTGNATLPANPTAQQVRDAISHVGTSLLVTWLVTSLATILLAGLVTVAVSRATLGQRVSLSQSWEILRPALGRLLLAALLLTAIGALGAVALVVLGLAALSSSAVLASPLVLLVAAMVWFGIASVFTSVVAVLEGFGPIAALRRSLRLVRGAWWRTFGSLLLAAFVAGLVAGVVAAPFGSLANARANGDSLFGPALGQVLADTITGPFVAAFLVLLYLDRRMRREGLATQLQQALHEPPAPGTVQPPTESR